MILLFPVAPWVSCPERRTVLTRQRWPRDLPPSLSRLPGASTGARCVGHAFLFQTDPVSPRCAPGAGSSQQGWGWDAPRAQGWPSRRWQHIRWGILHRIAFKPWESWRRGVSSSTAQKHVCFHYIIHLKRRWQGHPAQGDCALKRKRGMCLATCVCIAINQCTLSLNLIIWELSLIILKWPLFHTNALVYCWKYQK